MRSFQILPCNTIWVLCDLLWRTYRHDAASGLTPAGTHVDDVVSVADHIQVVLDDHHRGPVLDQRLEHTQQGSHIQGVQANRWLVEHEQGVGLGPSHLAGQL